MRHAKAEAPGGLADFERPLAKRGLKDATKIGKLLKINNIHPHRFLASNAVRAQQTAELVREHSAYPGQVEYSENLYLCEPNVMIDTIKQTTESFDSILVVAHNPTLEQVASQLTSAGKLFVEMPTACIIYLQVYAQDWGQIEPGRAVLKWMLAPKLIRDLDF